jgi:GTP-binding protein
VAIPIVAIVGRPNVGKSSLFNWLAGRRIAIVDSTAGVTRDRLTALIKLEGGGYFELVDTGGIGAQDADSLAAHVDRQIETAMEEANILLFVVDAREGLTPLDEEVARRLRYVTKPIITIANKCDTPELEPQAAEFYKLGRGKLIYLSAHQNRGRSDLLELIRERLPKTEEQPNVDVTLKLALVGRRNTGKSTFVNCIAHGERVIVSEVPGTTRDSVDVRFELNGKQLIAIDTAGVRRRQSISSDLEFYSVARAERSIRRADVVLLFMDPRLRISKVDKQLASYIVELHKPAVFVVNKWDLMVPMPTGKFAHYVRASFPSMDYVPIAFITAKNGKNVQGVINLAQSLHKQSALRSSTGDLNRVLRLAIENQAPPLRQNRRPKIFYGTQVAVNPPTIVLFTNGPHLFDETYERYLVRIFRDNLGFGDIPIKLFLRHKRREDPSHPEGAEPVEAFTPEDEQAQNEEIPAGVSSRRAGKDSRPAKPGLWKNV